MSAKVFEYISSAEKLVGIADKYWVNIFEYISSA